MTAVTFLGTAPGQPRAGSAHASILLERNLRQELPHLGRIVIHLEPEPGT